MKNKLTVAIGGLSLAVIIPLIILNLSYFKGFTSLDMFGYALSFAMILSSIFVIYILDVQEKINSNSYSILNLKTEVDQLSRLIKSKSSFIYAVKKEELYQQMGEFLDTAKNRIDLLYLGNKPPHDYQISTNRTIYHQKLENLILTNKITIRRIILYTDENKHWIKNVIDSKKNIQTFSLYILDDKFINTVSIQIFDDSKSVLINLDSSDTSLKSRDIIIDSNELNQIFESYYNRILRKAIPLIENGKLNTNNYRKYF